MNVPFSTISRFIIKMIFSIHFSLPSYFSKKNTQLVANLLSLITFQGSCLATFAYTFRHSHHPATICWCCILNINTTVFFNTLLHLFGETELCVLSKFHKSLHKYSLLYLTFRRNYGTRKKIINDRKQGQNLCPAEMTSSFKRVNSSNSGVRLLVWNLRSLAHAQLLSEPQFPLL